MDTEFTVSFASPNGLEEGETDLCAAAAAAAFARLDELELLLTRFNDTSDVAVIRGLKPGEVAVVARETMEVLTTAATVCAATAGAFDPTVKARNFGALVLDAEHLRVSVKEAPVELDFGGIGKGYALDEMAALLRSEQYGLDNWLLDAGTSTILASGGPWPLGVGGVWKGRTRLPTVLKLSAGALSVGGGALRQWFRDSRRAYRRSAHRRAGYALGAELGAGLVRRRGGRPFDGGAVAFAGRAVRRRSRPGRRDSRGATAKAVHGSFSRSAEMVRKSLIFHAGFGKFSPRITGV